jgi:uncharacterized protein with GYD domain
MAIYIITGNYTTDGAKGMMAHPTDRMEAVRPLIAAGGGTILSYYVTMGESDFQITVEGDDIEGVMASLIVAGASGGVCNMRTQPAFTPQEFLAAQKRAGALAASFKAPNQT